MTTRACDWIEACTCTCHWSGTVALACRDRVEQRLPARRRTRASSRNEPWSGKPSRHSAAQTIVPPGLHDLRRGRHPLHRLVEVLVEREARVGRHDDVERAASTGAHRQLARDRDAGRGVHRRTGRRRRPATIRCSPSRITSSAKSTPVAAAIARTSSCTGLPSSTPQVARGCADPRRVVQRQHRLEPGQARRDQLRAAAEAGEEVRLDEAGRDPDVGLDPAPVQPDRHAGAERARPRRARRRRARRG